MNILVLGAGVVGVTSAWYLAKSGHEVTVVDRREAAGMETSFANAGQISVSHAEPWANPGAPLKILKWLGREDAPLLFRLRADPKQWIWGMRFLMECFPARARENTLTILRLAIYSRDCLQALRRETGIEYDHLEKGILHVHTDAREFEAAHGRAELMRSMDVDMQIKTPEEALEIEPALRHSELKIVGATYAPEDESGDAHKFTRNLAAIAEKQGVKFRFDTEVESILVAGNRVAGVSVRTAEGPKTLTADVYLVSLGSYGPALVAPIGVHLPIFPVKGYSVTIPIGPDSEAPTVCITDENAKMAMSRLGDRLRAAGTAELAGFDASVREARCQAIVNRVRKLFPNAGDFETAQKWAGLRPATPSNVPAIGCTRYPNLFLNTGHGTLGWTLACGSAKAISDFINGRRPEIEFPFP
jgi:D-amino-acid dehydrogenase